MIASSKKNVIKKHKSLFYIIINENHSNKT
jgi:hypothetical protein